MPVRMRSHLLKIKHIRLKEKYGEGEIPHEAKTGTGPVLLTMSFLMYVIGSMSTRLGMNRMRALFVT